MLSTCWKVCRFNLYLARRTFLNPKTIFSWSSCSHPGTYYNVLHEHYKHSSKWSTSFEILAHHFFHCSLHICRCYCWSTYTNYQAVLFIVLCFLLFKILPKEQIEYLSFLINSCCMKLRHSYLAFQFLR